MHGIRVCIAAVLMAALANMVPGSALAAELVVGSVLAVRGDVFSDTTSGQQPLKANAPVRLGDTIVSASGKAKIALNDGTVVSVGENSRVRVADYERAPGSTGTRVSLVAGALRSLVTKTTATGKFEIETETAVAAVRGTDWVVEVTADQTSVAVVSGEVAVTSRAPQAQATVVLNTPGQGTDVRRGSAPTPVATWGAQRFSSTLARATFD